MAKAAVATSKKIAAIPRTESLWRLSPRSQTLFGNVIVPATLLSRLRNRVSKTRAFPNRVWERGFGGFVSFVFINLSLVTCHTSLFLFCSQCCHRADFGRPSRGQPGCEQCRAHQDHGCDCK